MTSLNTKLILSALGIALLAGPAVAQRLPDQSTSSAAPIPSGTYVMVRGQVVGADPDAQIRSQLFREWDSLHGE
jgi:hypothetical protein